MAPSLEHEHTIQDDHSNLRQSRRISTRRDKSSESRYQDSRQSMRSNIKGISLASQRESYTPIRSSKWSPTPSASDGTMSAFYTTQNKPDETKSVARDQVRESSPQNETTPFSSTSEYNRNDAGADSTAPTHCDTRESSHDPNSLPVLRIRLKPNINSHLSKHKASKTLDSLRAEVELRKLAHLPTRNGLAIKR